MLGIGLSQKVEAECIDRYLAHVNVSFHREDLLLPEMQRKYIDIVLKHTKAKVILVLFSGGGAVELRIFMLQWIDAKRTMSRMNRLSASWVLVTLVWPVVKPLLKLLLER